MTPNRAIVSGDFQYDFGLVGSGLQSGLIAMALRHHQPEAKILIAERNHQMIGRQTWSCHESDIPTACRVWFEAIPRKKWPTYLVRLNDFQREVKIGYQSIRSHEFHPFMQELANQSDGHLTIRPGNEVVLLKRQQIKFADGQLATARCVIDCRGPVPVDHYRGLGYQKFFGWEVELEHPWSIEIPMVMDAGEKQEDGFRFYYVLPFTEKRILIQDTRFSNSPDVDRQDGAKILAAYLLRHGHRRFSIVRQEHGCLPMPFVRKSDSSMDCLSAGYRGGWFHAATGYSLPLAVQFADAVAKVAPDQAALAIVRLWRTHRTRAGMSRFLNRMLFCLLRPEARQQIFLHFYKSLPEPVISRFYAHTFSQLDCFRLFMRKPPSGLTLGRFLQSFKAN